MQKKGSFYLFQIKVVLGGVWLFSAWFTWIVRLQNRTKQKNKTEEKTELRFVWSLDARLTVVKLCVLKMRFFGGEKFHT